MDWREMLIKSDEADFGKILDEWWSWLLLRPYRPVLMTAFGDWFLIDDAGRIDMLDLLEGDLSPVANSLEELNSLMQNEETRDRWLLPGFVESMERAGIERPAGECFGYKLHPVIGGQIASSNLVLLGIRVWQAICSQIHQQVRQIRVERPDGRIKRMEYLGGLTVRLITE